MRGQDSSIPGSQSQHRIRFISPIHRASHTIIDVLELLNLRLSTSDFSLNCSDMLLSSSNTLPTVVL